jgi:hypothetical protein
MDNRSDSRPSHSPIVSLETHISAAKKKKKTIIHPAIYLFPASGKVRTAVNGVGAPSGSRNTPGKTMKGIFICQAGSSVLMMAVYDTDS